MPSIRGRLLAGLLALVAVTTLCAGIITYRQLLVQTSTLLDYQLRQVALSVRDQAAIGPGVLPPTRASGSDLIIQIWDPFGNLRYYAYSRPGLPIITHAILGYADMTLPGQRWRVYSLDTLNGVIQVAQPWSVRDALAREAALRVLAPLLLLLLAMAAAVVWIVGRGLAPLRRLAGEVQRRDASSLAPITAPDLPEEAAPLIQELNRLLARLAEAFDKQRAFVADAAHELRSPLTALSLQLQLLDRAPDETARREARSRLGGAIERAIHLAGQLLTLARHEPEGAPSQLQPTALDDCARAGIADVHALAAQRGIELSLAADASVTVEGDADALRILVRNLVDNAVRYGPAGGRVIVRIDASGARPRLAVEDEGPGIPPAERDRAFDRFFRRPEAGEGGTGLGLAIVKAIADRHHAQIRLEDAQTHGLRVVVTFPQDDSAGTQSADPAPHPPRGQQRS
jgi:two-component system OmpR family sensor kinase/two-component system sensor histidine kinase QseC